MDIRLDHGSFVRRTSVVRAPNPTAVLRGVSRIHVSLCARLFVPFEMAWVMLGCLKNGTCFIARDVPVTLLTLKHSYPSYLAPSYPFTQNTMRIECCPRISTSDHTIELPKSRCRSPPRTRFLVGYSSPFMRLAEHFTAHAWSKQYLPSRRKPDVLRSRIVGMGGSVAIRLRPCNPMSIPHPPTSNSSTSSYRDKGRLPARRPNTALAKSIRSKARNRNRR